MFSKSFCRLLRLDVSQETRNCAEKYLFFDVFEKSVLICVEESKFYIEQLVQPFLLGYDILLRASLEKSYE